MVAFSKISFHSAGESHGPYLSAILEGIPAGLHLHPQIHIDPELKRRQKKLGASARMRIETDTVEISAGLIEGITTGAPLALKIINKNHEKWLRPVQSLHVPRPGHADYVGGLKYGYSDLRPSLERASARETAMRVACGAIAKALLSELHITVGSYVQRIGPLALDVNSYSLGVDDEQWKIRFKTALTNQSSSPDTNQDKKNIALIEQTRSEKETIGGSIQAAVLGLPVGLGSFSQWYKRLDSRLAAALMSIPSVKAVEIGEGIHQSHCPGSVAHDAFSMDQDHNVTRQSNHAGGIEAGVSNGMPLLARLYFKAIPTVLKGYDSVDLSKKKMTRSKYERSDICILPRACPVVESMLALLTLDVLLEKVGGDSMLEIKERFFRLPSNNCSHFKMPKEKINMYSHLAQPHAEE